jgi:CTP:phosphocholine cytidylyltransferase-like protein
MIPKKLIKKTIVDLSNEGLWNIEFVSGKKRYKVKYNKEKDEVLLMNLEYLILKR